MTQFRLSDWRLPEGIIQAGQLAALRKGREVATEVAETLKKQYDQEVVEMRSSKDAQSA